MAINPTFLIGTATSSPFAPQFPGAHVGGASFACTPIVYFGRDGSRLGQHASGFFYRYGEDVFLVSAWHCFSGRDAFTNLHISSTAFEPDEIEVYVALEGHTRVPLRINLLNDGDAIWLSDPERTTLRTDIAAVRINGNWRPEDVFCVNDDPIENLLATVGADVFVCGYPSPHYAFPYAPIWRRGSFAYEPGMPLDGKPIFLIDAQVSKGMSGSAIFQRWFGPAPIQRGAEIEMLQARVITQRFIGVYGGRVQDEATGPIGYGWYGERLTNVISGQGTPSQLLSPFRDNRPA